MPTFTHSPEIETTLSQLAQNAWRRREDRMRIESFFNQTPRCGDPTLAPDHPANYRPFTKKELAKGFRIEPRLPHEFPRMDASRNSGNEQEPPF